MDAFETQTIRRFLETLSSSAPTPGGGGAAALAGAVAASLGLMALSVSTKKSDSPALDALREPLQTLREGFLRLAEDDETAFSAVMEAYRIPRDAPHREAVVAAALGSASVVPEKAADACLDLLALLSSLVPLVNRQIVSDVGVGAHLASACLACSLLTLQANLTCMAPSTTRDSLAAHCADWEGRGSRMTEAVLAQVRERMDR